MKSEQRLPSTKSIATKKSFQKGEDFEDPGTCIFDSDRIQWYLEGRKHSRRELFADQVVLVFGALASVPAAVCLIWHTATKDVEEARLAGVCIYCMGFILMLNFSLLFHRNAGSERWTPVFLFLDKMGINCMIAGSYTPMCVQSGAYGLLAIAWSLALFGFVWELVMWKRDAPWKAVVDLVRFVCAGWIIMAFLPSVLPYMANWACYTVLAHGIIYTVGAFFLQWKTLEFNFCIWHSLVLVAASLFYIVVWTALAVGPPSGPALGEKIAVWHQHQLHQLQAHHR